MLMRLPFVVLLLSLFAPQAAMAERMYVPGFGEFGYKGRSYASMRYDGVVRQKLDFSCGSAALASLLTYDYGIEVSEAAALQEMYAHGDKEKIHREGFSMLDMKNYLNSIGLRAEGYRESLDKLARVGVPAIVLINRNGYSHFVVVKGVTSRNVLVGDPAAGLRIHSRANFEKMWNGIMFVVLDLKATAKASFNSKENWAKRNVKVDSSSLASNTALGIYTLGITPSPNYY